MAMHYACPFGAVSSVYAWEEIGDMITKIARRLLHLVVLRYVDDYFGPERKESLEHAIGCFVRIVRALLGSDSIADCKVEWGERVDHSGRAH
jgi:hypothetical protein